MNIIVRKPTEAEKTEMQSKPTWGCDVCDMLSRFGNRLMALHLHDNNGVDDQHLLPYDGTTEWSVIMKKIAQADYKGAVSLEVVNLGYEDLSPEEFLHLAFERADKLERLR